MQRCVNLKSIFGKKIHYSLISKLANVMTKDPQHFNVVLMANVLANLAIILQNVTSVPKTFLRMLMANARVK